MPPLWYVTPVVNVTGLHAAFIKLHFSLTNAAHWMNDYDGFNYEEFYEFIIDFFEADQSAEGKAAATELYTWWNVYVSNSISGSAVGADPSSGKYSQSLPRHEQHCVHRCDNRRSRNCKNSAAELA